MGREGRDYWVEQLSEYWDSGLTIQEYSELKELPYEMYQVDYAKARCEMKFLKKNRKQTGVKSRIALQLMSAWVRGNLLWKGKISVPSHNSLKSSF